MAIHGGLIWAGVGWFAFWGLLAWMAWMSDPTPEFFDRWIALPVVILFVAVPSLGLVLAGLGLLPGIVY